MKLTARESNSAKHILLFGPPKSGKTFLAGTLASKYNLLWFDLENGVDTLLQLPKEHQARVEVISIPDTRSYPIAIETMLKAIKGTAIKICEAHGKVSCPICTKNSAPMVDVNLSTLPKDTIVVVDSLTQLTNSAIAFITKDKSDEYKMEYDDWANLGKLMDTFLSHVQQSSAHILCISHETEVEMEDGKQKLVPTAGTRNFSRNTAKYFGEVIYCEIKNRKHVAASTSTYSPTILTGSRMGISLESKPGEADLVQLFEKKMAPSPAVASLSTLANSLRK